MSLIAKARRFATRAHADKKQFRKYTGQPYIVHPAAVANLVQSVPHTEEQVAAAWLHDTVEDTDVTLDDIREYFGDKVAELVEMLTDTSKPEDGTRAVRKQIDLEHTAKASPEAKTIKLADLIDNTESIVVHDPVFAKTYLQEKVRLLEVLKEGNQHLWEIASKQVEMSLNQ